MAVDIDGTVGLTIRSDFAGGPTEFTPAEMAIINNEAENSVRIGGDEDPHRWVIYVFPELRDFKGVFYSEADSGFTATLGGVQVSSDSTNGISGTWTELAAEGFYPTTTTVGTIYRTQISTFDAPGIRSVRFGHGRISGNGSHKDTRAYHVYANIPTTQSPDRVLFIDNSTGLVFDSVHDWGDVPRGTTLDKYIKLKNNSATLTANTIDLEFSALTGTSDTWYTLSDSGGAFATTLQVASISPGISYPVADVIRLRLTVAGGEGLGLQAARLSSLVTTWT